jgi:SAM-dependent methyltransferase
MLQENVLPILDQAETIAAGGDINRSLDALRRLSLDDFGLFLLELPSPRYPKLSRLLPRMASAEVQTNWTGTHGVDLLRQTTAFVRVMESLSWKLTGAGLKGRSILDFGCGYGRMMRLMYYFSDPEQVTGIDCWEKSLELARADGILGGLVKSDPVPRSLAVERHEVAFAFSVFTHLSQEATTATLAALRGVTKLFLVLTIRPVEFWDYYAGTRDIPKEALIKAHRDRLFAHHPDPNRPNYGDTSIHFDYFKRVPGWEFVGYERLLMDPYQTILVLRPA